MEVFDAILLRFAKFRRERELKEMDEGLKMDRFEIAMSDKVAALQTVATNTPDSENLK